ncbi:hypothetical protein FA95DRAFT_1556916 [Auriscalpium vulgare]|uniref:Uncharacterized protein n=1 Tax=Auriscalpium vulgare TaxID=40419 RepID=A0ACB8RZ95_9AGAM|nr:hypothetical protein FA95DRAFT_1556916 [Auriscalpium vulgare]
MSAPTHQISPHMSGQHTAYVRVSFDSSNTYLRVAFDPSCPYAMRPALIVSMIHPALFHVGATGWLQIFAVPKEVWVAQGGRIVGALVRTQGVISVDVMKEEARAEQGSPAA